MYDMRDWLGWGKPCKAEEYELLASCWQVAGKPPRLILSLWNLPVFFAKGIRCLAIFEQWPYDVHSAIDWFFPCQFFLISPNAVLRNPGEIVDSTVKGSHEASSNWLRPSCSFWTWAFLPFQSPCRLSMCPVFYVAKWFFLPEKEAEFYSPRNAVLLHDILWSSQPKTMSWDGLKTGSFWSWLVGSPMNHSLDPNWIPIKPHEILLKLTGFTGA